jgi:hypothetical protein
MPWDSLRNAAMAYCGNRDSRKIYSIPFIIFKSSQLLVAQLSHLTRELNGDNPGVQL